MTGFFIGVGLTLAVVAVVSWVRHDPEDANALWSRIKAKVRGQ